MSAAHCNDWPELIDDMHMIGRPRVLALACEPIEVTPGYVRLLLPQDRRAFLAYEHELRAVLERHFGCDVTLSIETPDDDISVRTRTGRLLIDRRPGWTVSTHRLRS